MLAVADFVSKFENYSDEELYAIHLNHEDYSEEAREALNIVLKKKGGVEKVLNRIEERRTIENEIQKIKKETAELGKNGIDSSFIKSSAKSDILSQEKVNEIVDNQFAKIEQELDDKKIKPRTIAGGIIGGTIAAITGGILWGLQLIYSGRIFLILGIGLALLCYGIISAATKQSKNNIVVLIATVISIIIAIGLGQLLYEIVGYRE
jgi:hypothetical protein